MLPVNLEYSTPSLDTNEKVLSSLLASYEEWFPKLSSLYDLSLIQENRQINAYREFSISVKSLFSCLQ